MIEYPIEIPVLRYMLDDGGFRPDYAHEDDAGMDLRLPDDLIIGAGERITVDLKIHFYVDPSYYIAIVPKSGLASKYGLTITNSPGTVDSGYTGNVMVILQNTGSDALEFKRGDKICQAIFKKRENVFLVRVFEKPDTERGEGGFGSSGR